MRGSNQYIVTCALLATLMLTGIIGCGNERAWIPPEAAEVGFRSDVNVSDLPTAPLELPETILTLQTDFAFETGASTLTSEARSQIGSSVGQLDEADFEGSLCIEGFADGIGNTAKNQILSEARAGRVADAFGAAGFTLLIIGHGEDFAKDNVDDPLQRKVEVSISTECPIARDASGVPMESRGG